MKSSVAIHFGRHKARGNTPIHYQRRIRPNFHFATSCPTRARLFAARRASFRQYFLVASICRARSCRGVDACVRPAAGVDTDPFSCAQWGAFAGERVTIARALHRRRNSRARSRRDRPRRGITQHIGHASRQLECPLSLDSGLRLRSVALGCARLSPRVMPARSPNAHTTAWCRGAGRGSACPPSVCSAA